MAVAAVPSCSELDIVVVSLAAAEERRARVERMMAEVPWRWRFFDARTQPPPSLPYDAERAVIEKGRTLSPAELACFASHYDLLRGFAEGGGAEYMLVLEDDVHVDPNFWFASLPELMRRGGIDMLRLYARFLHRSRHVARISDRHSVVRFTRQVFGTQAYVVSREGARRLTAPIRKVVRPCDDEFDRFWKNRVPLYALFPFPVLELEGRSTIHGRGPRSFTLTPRQTALRQIFRRTTKLRRVLADKRLKARDRAVAARLRGAHFG